ncbi:MAG: response regulator [Paenibacillus sp.]|jgi:signal transduction histidine kinase/DNA-binding response OmpR family regulator|nr:response regulator [Paenibacillus sp.]
MSGKRSAAGLRISGYLLYFILIVAGVAGFTYMVNGGLSVLNAKEFTSLHAEEQWEASIGDIPFQEGRPDYSAAEWKPFEELAASPKGKENRELYWLRLKLPKDMFSFRDPHLSVRGLMSYEIYMDQQKIFEFNMADRSRLVQENLEWNLIPFPVDYLDKTVYLRIFPSDKGLVNGQLLAGEGKDWIIELLKHDTLKLVLTVCFSFLFFIAMGAYLLYNREALHLYFAILCISASYYSFFQSSVIKLYITLPVTAYFVDLAIPLGTFAFLGMLGYLTDGLVRKIFRLATPAMLFFLCISFVLSLFHKQLYLLTMYKIHTGIVILIALSSIFIFNRLRKSISSESFWLFAGFCCFGFFSAGRYLFMMSLEINVKTFELFPIFFYYWKEDLFFVGVFMFVICLGMVIVSRLRGVHRQVQIYADELEEKNIRLQQFDKIKDDFLEGTSHELRTPLHGMIGLSESLLDGVAGPLSLKAQHNLQLVVASGKRLARLVNDILDIAKLKHKDIVLQLEPVKVKDVAGIVLAVFGPLMRGKSVALRNLAGDGLPLVMADPNRLQQILYNLVGNAVKFTPSGEITVSAKVEADMLRLTVKDTGTGIPQDKLSVIFEPYEQAGSLHGPQGTGLGLTLTRKLVELHGGFITVDSVPGEGTSCSFTLPLADVTMHEAAAWASSGIPHLTAVEADIMMQTVTESGTAVETVLEPGALLGTGAEAETEIRVQTAARAEAETEARVQTAARAEAETEARVQTARAVAETEARVQTGARSEAGTETQVQTAARSEAETEARVQTGARSEAETEARVQTAARSVAGTEARVQTARAEAETEARVETAARAEAGPTAASAAIVKMKAGTAPTDKVTAATAAVSAHLQEAATTRPIVETGDIHLIASGGHESRTHQHSDQRNLPNDAVILLVDDEPVNMQVLDNYLANEHARLLKAYSGEEALASIRRHKPDLVLLDVMLPDRNGYDVCQTIRQTYSASELPVILLTAKSQLADLMQGFDSGANDYMTKPLSKQELLARVRIQLQLSRLTHSLEQLVQERTADLLLTNRLLENSMQETAEAMAELLILEERNRIAGDIHDIVGHTLTTTIVHLEGAKLLLAKNDDRGFDKVLLSQELVRKGLEEIRESVHQINPSGDHYDLEAECIQLLDRTAQAAGAEIIYNILPLPQLQLQQKKTLYHALKEGLTNGLRHGACDQFRFSLAAQQGQISFSLWNNGRSYEAERAGTGLRAMSQRVRQFGGVVKLASPDEGGCLLTVTLPI